MQKTWLRRIHLALALISGLLLINLSLSGALLVYAKEIQRLVNPQYWTVEQSSIPSKRPVLTLTELTNKVYLATGQKVTSIEIPENNDTAWQIRLENKNYLSIDQYSGKVLLEYGFYETFYGFVMAWHRWLLYSNEKGDKPLQMWISIASLLLIFELLIGVYLWVKPKNRIKRLKIRWQAKYKVLFQQLHNVIGVYCCLPLILIAFSGMAFYWQDATKSIVEAVTLSQIETRPTNNFDITKQNKLQLDTAYQAAHNALEDGIVYRIYLPQTATEPLVLRIKMPEESHAYSWSWANPYTGEHLASYDATASSTATKVWHFKYKFHIGDFIAWPVKLLWLLLSLLPSFFVISGVYLYLKRRSTKRNLVTPPVGHLVNPLEAS